MQNDFRDFRIHDFPILRKTCGVMTNHDDGDDDRDNNGNKDDTKTETKTKMMTAMPLPDKDLVVRFLI